MPQWLQNQGTRLERGNLMRFHKLPEFLLGHSCLFFLFPGSSIIINCWHFQLRQLSICPWGGSRKVLNSHFTWTSTKRGRQEPISPHVPGAQVSNVPQIGMSSILLCPTSLGQQKSMRKKADRAIAWIVLKWWRDEGTRLSPRHWGSWLSWEKCYFCPARCLVAAPMNICGPDQQFSLNSRSSPPHTPMCFL